MNLRPEEEELVGAWIFEGGRMRADDVCERIEYLLSNVLEPLRDSLQHGAWETLYRDPTDGRLWERTYPQGDLQGGGPPRLSLIEREAAIRKYGSFL